MNGNRFAVLPVRAVLYRVAAVAVTVAVPSAIAVTLPVPSTLAIVGADDVQVTLYLFFAKFCGV